MATSNNNLLVMTGLELIMSANRLLNQYGSDVEQPTQSDYEYSLSLLNMFMKHTQTYNSFLWKRQQGFLFLDSVHQSYTLSSDDSVGWHATESYFTTVTTESNAAGVSSIVVSSTSGMTDLDYMLIPKSDGTYQVVTISPTSSTTVFISDPLEETISTGTRIYTYTTKLDKPVRIYSVGRRRHNSDGTPQDIFIQAEKFDDYLTRSPAKASISTPVSWAYVPGRQTGQLYTIGIETRTSSILVFTYQKQIETIVSNSDEIDYPSEWFLALSMKLAYYLALTMNMNIVDKLAVESNTLIRELLYGDVETAPTRLENGMN